MKIVAVTACPTGIAHTYMAADILIKEAKNQGIKINVETQGAMGIEDLLDFRDIANANCILIASDIEIEQFSRFNGLNIIQVSTEDVLTNVKDVFEQCRKSVSLCIVSQKPLL